MVVSSRVPHHTLPTAWQVVWITGASSGIGRDVAIKLAAAGAKVAVSARTAAKLAELEALSPNIKAYPLDVTDLAATKRVAADIERDLGPIDLALLNAGVWYPMGIKDYDPTTISAAMAVNFTGITHGLAPLLPAMTKRKSGHIAIVSSVAGYRGLPVAISYAPTKAAAISLAETLYLELRDQNVKVTVINPGFVDTDMTKINKFPMPFMVSSDDAANRIIAGLKTGRFEIVFPRGMALLSKLTRVLPYRLFFAFINLISDGEDDAPKPPNQSGR
jgi:short-subunit dehydrogenase